MILWRIEALWRELMTPSPRGEGGYAAMVIGIAHATAVGAVARVALDALGLTAVWWPLVVGAAYWLIKERRDLSRGGSRRDGIEDAAWVALGACYGPQWWPIAITTVALVRGLAGMRKHPHNKGGYDA